MPHANVPRRCAGPGLVTGAGGPAAVSRHEVAERRPGGELLAADMDPWAAGLYLVPPERGR